MKSDALLHIHPSLRLVDIEGKGRGYVTSAAIPKGTLLMRDYVYALSYRQASPGTHRLHQMCAAISLGRILRLVEPVGLDGLHRVHSHRERVAELIRRFSLNITNLDAAVRYCEAERRAIDEDEGGEDGDEERRAHREAALLEEQKAVGSLEDIRSRLPQRWPTAASELSELADDAARVLSNCWSASTAESTAAAPCKRLHVCLLLSLTNHNCDHNASIGSDPYNVGYAIMAADRDIDEAEEIAISYLTEDAGRSTDERRQLLLNGWGFHCQCALCTAGTASPHADRSAAEARVST